MTGTLPQAYRAVAADAAEPVTVSSVPASTPSAGALRAVARQMRHRLSDMELRSPASWPASNPSNKTAGYVVSEVADWQLRQWLSIIENQAQAIEARSDKTGTGLAEGESAVAKPCAQTPGEPA